MILGAEWTQIDTKGGARVGRETHKNRDMGGAGIIRGTGVPPRLAEALPEPDKAAVAIVLLPSLRSGERGNSEKLISGLFS